MAWFKVDDKLHSHKKTMKAGEAMALWVVAGSWCADHLTDGFVPEYVAERLLPDAADMAQRLVDVGLWTPATRDGDTGWQYNDWTEYQPTAGEVEDRRRKRAEAGRIGGQRSKRQANAQASAQADASTMSQAKANPDPTRPDPNPTTPKDDDASSTFDTFWSRYLRHHASGKPGGGGSRKKALDRWRRMTDGQREQALTAVEHYRAWCESPEGEWPAHATTWLNEQRWEQWLQPAARAGPAAPVDRFDPTPYLRPARPA